MSSDSEGDGILHGTQVTKLLRLNKEEDESPVGENGGKSKVEGCTDLLILGLPFKLEESELKTYFEKFGTVNLTEVDLVCECFVRRFSESETRVLFV